MRHKSFVIFILTHGRASNVKTLKTLRKAGYTGKVVLVIDNEDELEKDYYRIYGKENVYMFDKQDIADRYDQMDNFEERRTIFYARNACFEIARKLGYKYFLELDDDYTSFDYRMIQNKRLVGRPVKTFDEICDIMLDFLDITKAYTVAFAQGGDLIGGKDNKRFKDKIIRKAMNSFFCRTDRQFEFKGRVNEDVNTYCLLGTQGKLMFTYIDISLTQVQTQKQKGGMSEQYLDSGTFLKSFYSVMCCPSCVTVNMMGSSKNNMRLHHNVSWNNCTPKIISDRYKK